MSFTVKVIFVGLIGFVPSPDAKNDMVALLVNPESPQHARMECPAPPHLPIVLLLKGKCKGDDCYRVPDHLKEKARAMGFDGLLKNRDGGLLWLLDQEVLDISDDGGKLKFKNPWRFPWAAPRSVRQSTDFDWVPSMSKLSSGQGQINTDCLDINQGCPLRATFQFQGGTAGVCHVFHDQSRERSVRIFEYLIPGQRLVRRRAVADAVQWEFDGEGKDVLLESKNRGHTKDAQALLSPEDREITLIVANISPFLDEKDHSSQHGCRHAHSDIFFQLLQDRNVPRPVRVLSEKKGKIGPGPCEQEVSSFVGLLLNDYKEEVPHAITACDGVSFPKPTQ